MANKVAFDDQIDIQPFYKESPPHALIQTKKSHETLTFNDDGYVVIGGWVGGVIVLFLIIFLVIWIMGLVRMGRCGGRKCWLWWCTIFIPLFVPGIGQLWGLVVGILALTMLRNGRKLLTMQCPKN